MPRPVLATFAMLERRWALRLIWELRRDALGFAELRQRTGASPSVLAQRLRELSEGGIVGRGSDRRYRLTSVGRELAPVLYDLNRWSEIAARERGTAILEP